MKTTFMLTYYDNIQNIQSFKNFPLKDIEIQYWCWLPGFPIVGGREVAARGVPPSHDFFWKHPIKADTPLAGHPPLKNEAPSSPPSIEK